MKHSHLNSNYNTNEINGEKYQHYEDELKDS